MSSEEAVTTAVEQIEEPAQRDLSVVMVEAEARAKLMKAILPQLVRVCYANNILPMKDSEGGTKPYINNDGCQKIARIAGISFGRPNVMISYEDMPAERAEYYEDSGNLKKPAKPARRAYIVEVEGEASILGQTVTEFGGASSEDGFYNRPKESPVEIRLEVRKKAMANWQGRCVRTLLGLQGLSWEDLEATGEFKRDAVEGVTYGKGKYSSQKDTSGDKQAADDARKKISDQILSDVANHKEAAGDLLERMTRFTGKDGKEIPGVRSTQKLSDARANTTWGRIKPGGKDRDVYQNAVADVNDKYDLWDKEPTA